MQKVMVNKENIKPLVSINCITYNHEKYISKAIEGFLMQKTSFDFEVLIGEDCSTDNTLKIVRKYEEKHPHLIKVITANHNVGTFENGLRLLEASEGKYIAMCEGDDYWTDPYKLQKQVDFLEANPEYVITYHNADIIAENGDLITNSKLSKDLQRDFSTDELIKGAWVLTLTMCFRNVIKEFPYEMSNVKNGDKFLTSLLGNFGKGKYLAEVKNAVYRKHINGIWSSFDTAKQIFFNGDTRAWLSRYYNRYGNVKYAEYFKDELKKHFVRVINEIESSNNFLIEKIKNEYNDLIKSNELNEMLSLLNSNKNKKNIKKENIVKVGQPSFVDSDILHVDWIVTRKCNYACSYCTVHDNKNGFFNPLESFMQAVDGLSKLKSQNISILLAGGEPTIYPQFFEFTEYIFKVLKERVSLRIQTNLGKPISFFQKFVERLKTKNKAIEIISSYHFEYANSEKYFQKIKLLVENNFNVVINLLAHPNHMVEIKALYKYIKSIESDNLKLNLVTVRHNYGQLPDKRYTQNDLLWLKQNYSDVEAPNIKIDYFDEEKKEISSEYYVPDEITLKGMNNFKGFKCNAGKNMISINADGSLDPAVCFRKINIKKPNIYKNPDALNEINGPLICPFENCGIPICVSLPKEAPVKEKKNKYTIKQAEQLIAENKLEEAEKILIKLYSDNSKNIDVLNDLAVVSIIKQDIARGLNYINQVLTIDSQNEIAIGNFQFIQENYQEMLIPKEKKSKLEESKILKVGAVENFNGKDVLNINWVLTRKCNYTCSYCTVYNNKDKFKPIDELKKAVDEIYKLNRDKIHIVLTGGEPTIYPKYLELLKYIFSKLKDKVSITTISNLGRTNRFFNDLIEKLKGYENKINFVASYHFDFAKENEFLQNVKNLTSNGYFVKVQIMAHPEKMEKVKYLEKELNKIKVLNLKYQVMVIRENYGSVPDKRYSEEDLQWLKQFYNEQNEEKNILMVRVDEEKNIIEEKYSAPELNTEGLNKYKGMICHAGVNNFSINEKGKVDRAVCFRHSSNDSKNIYTDENALKGMDKPVICPFERCGCTADLYIPKFDVDYSDKNILREEDDNQKLKQAEQFIAENKLEEAEKILLKLYNDDSRNIDVLNDLAVLSVMKEDIANGLNYINQIIEIDPQNEIAIGNLKYIEENYGLEETNETAITPNNNHDILINALQKVGWEHKKELYTSNFEYYREFRKVENPSISIIVISWRLHKDNIKNFQILEQQRAQNFELIFVNNGADEKEFEGLEPYIDKYIKLNNNTGAYLARNIGSIFAESPILFFLEDDGIPEKNIVEAHLDVYKKYEVIAVRGVYMPKTENVLNNIAHHYYLGDLSFPRYSELEGNSSYSSEAFFKVGGWDDEIQFGGGGIDLSIRLFEKYPEIHKQIYTPKPIIYHDYVKDENHLTNKKEKQELSFARLAKKHPNWTKYQLSWRKYNNREDLLVKKVSIKNNGSKLKNIIMFWYQNDWGLYGRRNEMLARTFSENSEFNKVIHIEPPINLDNFEKLSDDSLDANIEINKKRFEKWNDNNVITFTPTYRGKLTKEKLDVIFYEIEELLQKENIDNYYLWLYPPHFMSNYALTNLGNKAEYIVSDIVDDHRLYAQNEEQKKDVEKSYQNIISNSNICFAVSEKLCDDFQNFNNKIYYLPNAVEKSLLSYKNHKKPTEINNIKKPIIGYTGALSFRLDLELIDFVTSQLKDYNFVFIGTSPSSKLKEIANKENVHILPPVKHEKAKEFISSFDVCIVPHEDNEYTKSMNPLKIYEYLALNKPVVTTDINGVAEFQKTIKIAKDKSDFVKKIKLAIINKKNKNSKKVQKTIKSHTWENRITEIMQKINNSSKSQGNKERERYYSFSRPEVQALVEKSSKTILDVGCGNGEMASQLKQKLNAEVWGIEYVQAAADKASSKLDRVLSGKVEDALDKLPNNYFDTIIFADVLEHLTDPESVLAEIKKKLKVNGEIVASIPNIRHWSVLLDLIQGNWEYKDAGLLDRTHFRFFTRRSIVKMFNNLGIENLDLSAVSLPPNNAEVNKIWEIFKSNTQNIGLDTSTLAEEGLHYQYLVKAKINKDEIAEYSKSSIFEQPRKDNPKLVSIITLTYNQLKYTKEFVNSVFANTKYPFELIVVDNASKKDTVDYLRELEQKENVKIIYNKENLGFPKAVNQGILAAEGDYILIANNDIIVTKDWLSRMVQIAEENPQAALVGPISNAVSGVQIDKKANYKTIPEMHKYAEKVKRENKNQITEFPRIAFLCTLIKKEVIEKLGGLDERFTPGNFEDDDFCLRVQLSGYKAYIAEDVFIHHFGSVSFTANGKDKYLERLKINEQKFVNKWGVTIEDIWIKGAKVNQRKLEFPIDQDIFIQSLKRTFISVDDNEHDLALENLKIVLDNFDNSERKGCETLTKEELLNLAGSIALAKNDLEVAKVYFEQQLNANPLSSQACFGLGEVFSKAELYQESKTMLEWAVINDENNKNAKQRLQEVNLKLNLPGEHNSVLEEKQG